MSGNGLLQSRIQQFWNKALNYIMEYLSNIKQFSPENDAKKVSIEWNSAWVLNLSHAYVTVLSHILLQNLAFLDGMHISNRFACLPVNVIPHIEVLVERERNLFFNNNLSWKSTGIMKSLMVPVIW